MLIAMEMFGRSGKKSKDDGAVINGGFMVCRPQIFRYLKDDSTVFEKEPMNTLVKEKKLNAYFHKDFWQCMDTKREKDRLEELWNSGKAPWKVWND